MPKIGRLSRYYDGQLAQIYNETSKSYDIAVFRDFPENVNETYIEHTWVYGDNLSILANKYLGRAEYWWKIMEINPEITDPFSIEPGNIIRIPYAKR